MPCFSGRRCSEGKAEDDHSTDAELIAAELSEEEPDVRAQVALTRAIALLADVDDRIIKGVGIHPNLTSEDFGGLAPPFSGADPAGGEDAEYRAIYEAALIEHRTFLKRAPTQRVLFRKAQAYLDLARSNASAPAALLDDDLADCSELARQFLMGRLGIPPSADSDADLDPRVNESGLWKAEPCV